MKRTILILLLLTSVTNANAKQLVRYGVTYNPSIAKNEIWAIYDNNTEEKIIDFAFPSGGWQSSASFAEQDTGKLWLKDASGSYVVFDPETNGIEVITFGSQSYQASFPVAYIDSTIKTSTNSDGELVTQVGTSELVDSDGDSLISSSVNSSGTLVTQIGSNELVNASGDAMISTQINEDGVEEIHIGENSLITMESGGVQQLWAEDASGNAIDINIKQGTNLLINGSNIATGISTNTANIATNTGNIATNTANIATNTANIATNTGNIATNTGNIATNTGNIATNTANIANLNNRVDNLYSEMNNYSQGIADAIAMSQFDLSQPGFNIGVGVGRFQNETRPAIGFGYGKVLSNGKSINLRFSTTSDNQGLGFSMNF